MVLHHERQLVQGGYVIFNQKKKNDDNKKFKSEKRFMVFKTVNHFPKIKEAFYG